MGAILFVTIACGVLAVGACSKETAAPSAPGKAAAEPQPANVNIAAADMGGAVEELTGNYGPGFTGRRLVYGLLDPIWKFEVASPGVVEYPREAVISFFEREPAWIEAVTIVLPPDPAAAPKDVEVWTSMSNPYENFSRVATETLEAKSGERTVEFDAVEAKFVKLRVLSGIAPYTLEIAEVRVIEATRPGCTPLFVRAPLVELWKGSPREAAQRGLDWLQHAAPVWIDKHNCFGCHVTVVPTQLVQLRKRQLSAHHQKLLDIQLNNFRHSSAVREGAALAEQAGLPVSESTLAELEFYRLTEQLIQRVATYMLFLGP
jgi:hypothetical protein